MDTKKKTPPSSHPAKPVIPSHVSKPSGSSSSTEPLVIPAPKVENRVDIPSSVDITTVADLRELIMACASILYPKAEELKVSTAVTPSGRLCHGILFELMSPTSAVRKYKLLCKGPGVTEDKKAPAKGRRDALAALLEELEKRLGKEFL